MKARPQAGIEAQEDTPRRRILLPIGERVRALREAGGLSQTEVQELALLAPYVLQRIEEGAIAPTLFPLLRLADALATTPGTLLDDLPQAQGDTHAKEMLRLIATYPGVSSGEIARLLGRPRRYVEHILQGLSVNCEVAGTHASWPSSGSRAA